MRGSALWEVTSKLSVGRTRPGRDVGEGIPGGTFQIRGPRERALHFPGTEGARVAGRVSRRRGGVVGGLEDWARGLRLACVLWARSHWRGVTRIYFCSGRNSTPSPAPHPCQAPRVNSSQGGKIKGDMNSETPPRPGRLEAACRGPSTRLGCQDTEGRSLVHTCIAFGLEGVHRAVRLVEGHL